MSITDFLDSVGTESTFVDNNNADANVYECLDSFLHQLSLKAIQNGAKQDPLHTTANINYGKKKKKKRKGRKKIQQIRSSSKRDSYCCE